MAAGVCVGEAAGVCVAVEAGAPLDALNDAHKPPPTRAMTAKAGSSHRRALLVVSVGICSLAAVRNVVVFAGVAAACCGCRADGKIKVFATTALATGTPVSP